MIRASEVRVIGAEGNQVGILPLNAALEMAWEDGLDLVEVAPQETPPVCKIMDYGKFKYKQSKKVHEAKKRQRTLQIKELKLGPKMEEHDYQFKMKHAQHFLEEGNKVKFSVFFRGREIMHSHLGKNLLERMAQDLSEIGTIEQDARMEGRNFTMIIAPKGQ